MKNLVSVGFISVARLKALRFTEGLYKKKKQINR